MSEARDDPPSLRTETSPAAAAGGAAAPARVVDPTAAGRSAANTSSSHPSRSTRAPEDQSARPGLPSQARILTAEPPDVSPSPSDERDPKRTRISRDLERTHICSHVGCDKKFSRAEHLSRHELNHTAKQIFRCDRPGCGRAFVRRDLLTRHDKRHRMSKSGNVRTTRHRYDLPITFQADPTAPEAGPARLPAQELVERKDSTVDFHAAEHGLQGRLSPRGQLAGSDAASSIRHDKSPSGGLLVKAEEQPYPRAGVRHFPPHHAAGMRAPTMDHYATQQRVRQNPMPSADSPAFAMASNQFHPFVPAEASSRPLTATTESVFDGSDPYTPQSEHRRHSAAFTPMYQQGHIPPYVNLMPGSAATQQYATPLDALYRSPTVPAFPVRVETPTALPSVAGPAIASNLEQQAQSFAAPLDDADAQESVPSAHVGNIYTSFYTGIGQDSSTFNAGPNFDMNAGFDTPADMHTDLRPARQGYLPYEQPTLQDGSRHPTISHRQLMRQQRHQHQQINRQQSQLPHQSYRQAGHQRRWSHVPSAAQQLQYPVHQQQYQDRVQQHHLEHQHVPNPHQHQQAPLPHQHQHQQPPQPPQHQQTRHIPHPNVFRFDQPAALVAGPMQPLLPGRQQQQSQESFDQPSLPFEIPVGSRPSSSAHERGRST